MLPMIIDAVPATLVRPLRSRVLRKGTPPEALILSGDDDPAALHIAARHAKDTEIIGIATVYPHSPPEAHRGDIPEAAYADEAAFQLRGMAVAPEVRNIGVGRLLLERCFTHVREAGAEVLWCNARLTAVGFYRRLGMEAVGEEFTIEGIGPHYVMWRGV